MNWFDQQISAFHSSSGSHCCTWWEKHTHINPHIHQLQQTPLLKLYCVKKEQKSTMCVFSLTSDPEGTSVSLTVTPSLWCKTNVRHMPFLAKAVNNIVRTNTRWDFGSLCLSECENHSHRVSSISMTANQRQENRTFMLLCTCYCK